MFTRFTLCILFVCGVTAWADRSLANGLDVAPALNPDFVLTPDERDLLAKKKFFVRVQEDKLGTAAAVISGAVDIDAPRSVVWNVMLDCDLAPSFVPRLKKCEVIETGPDGLWDVREHQIGFGVILNDFINVFRSNYLPEREIQFHLVGGDLKTQEGVWRFETIGADQSMTRVHYRARLAVGKPVPRFLIRRTIRKDMPRIFSALKETAEAKANLENVSKL